MFLKLQLGQRLALVLAAAVAGQNTNKWFHNYFVRHEISINTLIYYYIIRALPHIRNNIASTRRRSGSDRISSFW